MFMSKDRFGKMNYVYEMGDTVTVTKVFGDVLFPIFSPGTFCTVMNGTTKKDENKLQRVQQVIAVEPMGKYMERATHMSAEHVKPYVIIAPWQVANMIEDWRVRQMTKLLLRQGEYVPN